MTTSTETTTSAAGKSDRWFLSSAGIWRALAHLCGPMIAAVSVGAIYNIINAGFIGSLHSTSMLSAISFGLPVFALMMAVGGVFGVGGSTAISRLMGAGDAGTASDRERSGDEIRRFAAFTFWGAIIGGAVVGAICLLLLGPIVAGLGAGGAAAASTAAYVGVQFAGAPILMAAFALEQIVRAEGAARASMVGLIASTVGNLVFDVLFILVLHWGVFGAGLALVVSNAISVGYYIWYLQRHSSAGISLSPRWLRVRLPMVKEVFSVGVSELLQSSFMIVTALLLNHLAVSYSDGVVAAFGVTLRISQLPEMLCMGVTIGVLPLIAYSFGARDHGRLRSAIRSSAITIGVFTIVFSGLVFLLREPVLGLFSSSPAVLTDGVLILTAQLVSTIFNGFTGLMIVVFQGIGAARASTIMSVAQGVLFIPVVLVANLLFGLPGLIWAMTVTEVLVFATGLILWAIEKPGRRNATEDQAAQALAMAEAAA